MTSSNKILIEQQYTKLLPQKSFFVQKLINKKKNSIIKSQLNKAELTYTKPKRNRFKEISNLNSFESLNPPITNKYFKIKLFGYKRLVKSFLIKKGKSKKFQNFTYKSHMFLNKRYPQFRLKTHIEIFFNRYAFPKIAIEKYPIFRKRRSKRPYHTYKLLGTHVEQKYIFNFFKDHLRQKLQRNLETKFESIFLTLASKKIDLNSVQRKKNKNMVEKWYQFHQGRFRFLAKEKKIKRQEFLINHKDKFDNPKKLAKLINPQFIRRKKMTRKELKRFREFRKLERNRKSYPEVISKLFKFKHPWKRCYQSARILPDLRTFIIKKTHHYWENTHIIQRKNFVHQIKTRKPDVNKVRKFNWVLKGYNLYLNARHEFSTGTYRYNTHAVDTQEHLRENFLSKLPALKKNEDKFWRTSNKMPSLQSNFLKSRTVLYYTRKKETTREHEWALKYAFKQTNLERKVFHNRKIKSLVKRIKIKHTNADEDDYVNINKNVSYVIPVASEPSHYIGIAPWRSSPSVIFDLHIDRELFEHEKDWRTVDIWRKAYQETAKLYDIARPKYAFCVAFTFYKWRKKSMLPTSSLLTLIEKQTLKSSPSFDVLLSKIFLWNTANYLRQVGTIYPTFFPAPVTVKVFHRSRPYIIKHRKAIRSLQRVTSLNREYILPYTKFRVKDVFNSKNFLNNYKKKFNFLCNKYSKISKNYCSIANSPFTLKLKNQKEIKKNKVKRYLDSYKPLIVKGPKTAPWLTKNRALYEDKKDFSVSTWAKVYTEEFLSFYTLSISSYLKDPLFKNYKWLKKQRHYYRRFPIILRGIFFNYTKGKELHFNTNKSIMKIYDKKVAKKEPGFEEYLVSSHFAIAEPYKYLTYFTSTFNKNHLDITAWRLLEKEFFAECLKINKKPVLGNERKFRFQKITSSTGSHFITALTINKPFWNLTNFEDLKNKPQIKNFSAGKFSYTGFVRSNIFFNDFIYNIPSCLKTALPTYRKKFPTVFKKNNFILNFQIKSWTKESLHMFNKTFESRLAFGINKLNIRIKSLPIQKKVTRRTVLTSPHVNKNAQQHLDQIKYSKIYLLECYGVHDSKQIFALIWKLIFLDLKANSLELKFISSIKKK